MEKWSATFIVFLFDPLHHKIRRAFCGQAYEGATKGYFLWNDLVSVASFHERHWDHLTQRRGDHAIIRAKSRYICDEPMKAQDWIQKATKFQQPRLFYINKEGENREQQTPSYNWLRTTPMRCCKHTWSTRLVVFYRKKGLQRLQLEAAAKKKKPPNLHD